MVKERQVKKIHGCATVWVSKASIPEQPLHEYLQLRCVCAALDWRP